MRLPLPQPSEAELADGDVYKGMARDSALLSLYRAPELLAEIKIALGIGDGELIKTDKQFDLKKAALDITVARLYGLSARDIEHILASFKVLRSKYPGYAELLRQMAREGLP
jgi:VIT1/CCC1 family predicted Fe2+/Mn2+ transporter